MVQILISLVLVFSSGLSFADNVEDLQVFAPDGCTASPDGGVVNPDQWKHCCTEHDFAYWQGGSTEDRFASDNRLRTCMNKSGGPGEVYYRFVRSAGLEYWSSAWPNNNINQNLTDEDKELIDAEYDLWLSLGKNPDFYFLVMESLLFRSLNSHQKLLIQEKAKTWFNTREHREFLRHYIQATGESPVLLKN